MKRKNKASRALPDGWEFSEAYRMLADAVLTYEEFDFSGLVRAGVHSLRKHGHTVACSNPRCHQGGYDLWPDIDLMMTLDPMRAKSIYRKCDGWERKPQSKRPIGDVCTGSIDGTLKLKLRGEGRWRSTNANETVRSLTGKHERHEAKP